MLPPQAPPAVVQSASQEAIDALNRLVHTHDWLVEQQANLPGLADEPVPAGRHRFLADLVGFWDASVTPAPGARAVSRAAAFAGCIAAVMNDEATLLRLDGTLDENAADLAKRFARSYSDAVPFTGHAQALAFGEMPVAGSVVVTDDRFPDLALLFTPDRGWEAFGGVDVLHRTVEQRTRIDLARGIYPAGIMSDDLMASLDAPFVGSRDFVGRPFDAIAHRIVALQQERVNALWQGLEATMDREGATRYFAERIAPALRLESGLDIPSLLAERERRLVQQLDTERLAGVPDDVRQAWREASEAYAASVRIAERQRQDAALEEVVPLDRFTGDVLRAELAARGIADDPGDIVVEVYDFNRAYFNNPTGAPDASRLGPIRKKSSLPNLALRNAGFFDTDIFLARGADGRDLSASLPTGAIKAMVRDLDIGTRYRNHILDRLGDTPDGRLTRAVALDVRKARMRFEAADARLGYFLTDEPRSFAPDHNFRGYRWVEAMLDAPDPLTRRTVEGHDVVVRQLVYRGEPVSDVLVIGARAERSVSRVVLYTPDAPDGVTFREFDDRHEAERQFLGMPAFETYLLDRLPAEFAETLPNGQRRFRGHPAGRRFRWALNLNDGAASSTRDEAFSERIVTGHAFDALYDTELSLTLRNLQSQTRSTAHATLDNVSPELDGETFARHVANLLGRPFQASWRAYDTLKAGDHAGAMVDLADAYVSSLDFLCIGAMRPVLSPALVVRGGQTGRRLVPAGTRPRDPRTFFDDRFAASVSLRDAQSVRDGVYRIGGHHYIEHGGRVYGVRRQDGTWRLTHRDSPTYEPYIWRNAAGQWEYVGLMGGLNPRLFPWDTGARPPAYRDLSVHQRFVVQETLIARVGQDEARRIAVRARNNPLNALTTRLTRAELAHWRAALDAGRRAPVVRPRPTVPPPAPPAHGAAPSSVWIPPPTLEEVLPAQWPDTLWYYPTAREALPQQNAGHLIVAQSRHDAAGALGIDAIDVGPRTPWARLSTMPGGPVVNRGPGPWIFEWVGLRLNNLRRRTDAAGQPMFRVFRVRDSQGLRYLIRPAGTAGDAPTAWFQQGEFDTGIHILAAIDLDQATAGTSRPGVPPP